MLWLMGSRMRDRNRPVVLLTLVIVAACAASAPARDAPAPFSADAFLDHVKFLASDALAGRATGTAGAEQAADYIAREFKNAGLRPAGPDESWYQLFEVVAGHRLNAAAAHLEVVGLAESWAPERDWTPLPFSAPGDITGPLAFAGYGIQAADHDWDDYGEFPLTDKVLLIFRYEPKADDPAADFGGSTPSPHALFWRKADNAHRLGARALLIVNPPDRDTDDRLFAYDSFRTRQPYALPMVHVSRALADAILTRAGQPNLATLQRQLDTQRTSLARDLGVEVDIRQGIEPNRLPARNVLGLVPGTGDTHDTIVVGAHYDHLGIRPPMQGADPTPRIHNGANDNASGTAGLIELARAVTQGPALQRDVLFVAFDAEELGLLGSSHFVEHPTLLLENIRGMINLDMIGRLDLDQFVVLGTATAQEFGPLVERAAADVGLACRTPGGTGGGGSDHAPFIRQHIPSLFLFTGTHVEYHQPEDDWGTLDAEGAVKLLQMSHDILTELANMPAGPIFTEPVRQPEEEPPIKPGIEERNEAAGEFAAAAQTQPAMDAAPAGPGMRLGIVPRPVGDGTPGLLVLSVVDGGPAKAAGLQDGDRILKIGSDEVVDHFAYMRILKTTRPGDEAEVVIQRRGETKTLRVRWPAAVNPDETK